MKITKNTYIFEGNWREDVEVEVTSTDAPKKYIPLGVFSRPNKEKPTRINLTGKYGAGIVHSVKVTDGKNAQSPTDGYVGADIDAVAIKYDCVPVAQFSPPLEGRVTLVSHDPLDLEESVKNPMSQEEFREIFGQMKNDADGLAILAHQLLEDPKSHGGSHQPYNLWRGISCYDPNENGNCDVETEFTSESIEPSQFPGYIIFNKPYRVISAKFDVKDNNKEDGDDRIIVKQLGKNPRNKFNFVGFSKL
jgi:hypothetical protein